MSKDNDMDILCASMHEADLLMEEGLSMDEQADMTEEADVIEEADEPKKTEGAEKGPAKWDDLRYHSFRHASLYQKMGSLISFETAAVDGHSGKMGLIRIPDMPHFRIPDYIDSRIAQMKHQGLTMWKNYKYRTKALEEGIKYFPEDFGATFSVLSMGKEPGQMGAVLPLAALNFPNLVAPVDLTMRNGPNADKEAWGYWIVCQYNFLPEEEKKNRPKRQALEEKAKEEAKAKAKETQPAKQTEARMGPPSKKPFKKKSKSFGQRDDHPGHEEVTSSFNEAARRVAERRERSRSARRGAAGRSPPRRRRSGSRPDDEAPEQKVKSVVKRVDRSNQGDSSSEDDSYEAYRAWRAHHKKSKRDRV